MIMETFTMMSYYIVGIILLYSVNQNGFVNCQTSGLPTTEKLPNVNLSTITLLLMNGFNAVKTKTGSLDEDLSLLEKHTEKNRKNFVNLQNSLNDLKDDLNRVNESLQDKQDKSVSKMRKPTFVSEWILMRAQDANLTEKTVVHGLGTLPYKVDVQIRPTTGPNAGWIFPGVGAVQSDDDMAGEVYGGIVYLYDETNVYLMAPLQSNNYNLGVVINTGSTKRRRLGNNHQTSRDAYVRVKVWAPSDFPEPIYKSEWLPLDISNTSLTYYEMPHGLNSYPGLVNVQIRCSSSNIEQIISEGVGSSVSYTPWSNAGGVVHAFNDDVVRIWTGYLRNTTGNYHFRLLGGYDGWKRIKFGSLDQIKGQFRVLAWRPLDVTRAGSVFEQHEYNKEFAEWSAFDKFSPDADLFSFYVQANDGANHGFRFPGYGNSQSTLSPFGGAVYAYSPNGDVRIWRPNPKANGYLVFVKPPFGNGVNAHVSNEAHYVSTLLRAN